MSPQKLSRLLSIAGEIAKKVQRSRKYAGTVGAWLAGNIRHQHPTAKPLLRGERWSTPEERAILQTRGNAAVKMNDFLRITTAEADWIKANRPALLSFTRTRRYDENEYWQDPQASRPKKRLGRERWSTTPSSALTPEFARPCGWSQLWVVAAPLPADDMADEDEDALALAIDEDADQDTNDADDGILEGTLETEDESLALNAGNFGEDEFSGEVNLDGEPLRSVIESDYRFRTRRSSADLDALFGEEPKDPDARTWPDSPSSPKGLDAFFEEEEPSSTWFFPLTSDGRPQDETRRRRHGDEGNGSGWLAERRAEHRSPLPH